MKIYNRFPFSIFKKLVLRIIPADVLYRYIAPFYERKPVAGQVDIIESYLKSHDIRKLQIGCGENTLDGWLNTDSHPLKGDIANLNACARFPLPDCSIDYILAEHLIEHLDYLQGQAFLKECYRVLKPGGKVRIATPDLDIIANIYVKHRNEIEERYMKFLAQAFSASSGAANGAFAFNQMFHGWGHRFIYDYTALENNLKSAGFAEIRRYKVGESEDVNLRNVEKHGSIVPAELNELETLVLEAVKLPVDS